MRCSVAWACGEATNDRDIAAALINALATREAPIDRIFFDWRGGRDPGAKTIPSEPFRDSRQAARRSRTRAIAPILVGREPCSMHIEEVEAIWSAIAERDDWQPFNDKVTAVRLMGEAMEQDAPAA